VLHVFRDSEWRIMDEDLHGGVGGY
jgi:hypothetical protein